VCIGRNWCQSYPYCLYDSVSAKHKKGKKSDTTYPFKNEVRKVHSNHLEHIHKLLLFSSTASFPFDLPVNTQPYVCLFRDITFNSDFPNSLTNLLIPLNCNPPSLLLYDFSSSKPFTDEFIILFPSRRLSLRLHFNLSADLSSFE